MGQWLIGRNDLTYVTAGNEIINVVPHRGTRIDQRSLADYMVSPIVIRAAFALAYAHAKGIIGTFFLVVDPFDNGADLAYFVIAHTHG